MLKVFLMVQTQTLYANILEKIVDNLKSVFAYYTQKYRVAFLL